MSAQSARFARILIARFDELGLETVREIEDAGGPSASWLALLRKAAREVDFELKRPRGDTAKRIDTAARWEPGTTRRVYDGADPTPVPATDSYVNPGLARMIDEADGYTAREKRRLKALLSQVAPELLNPNRDAG